MENLSDLRRPFLFDSVLSDAERSWFKQAMVRMIAGRTKDDDTRLRLYIEGNLMNTGYLYNNFLPHLPKGDEDLREWLRQTFGEVKFALFVNGCEKMDEAIPTAISRYMAPLLAKTGLPANGIQVDLIMGNYGYTPFGIHKDNIGDSTFHFHLGPSPKYFYTWAPDEYLNKLGGRQNEQDVEPFLPFATKYTIEEGAIFYLPWTEYHVGYTPELSMAVTATLQWGTKTTLISNVLQQLSADLLESTTGGHVRSEKTPETPREFGRLDEELAHNPLWNDTSFLQALELSYERLLLKSGSNGGMQARPVDDKEERPAAWFRDKHISIREPFPIFWREQRQRGSEVYARGHCLLPPKDAPAETLIRRLNDGGKHTYADLLGDAQEKPAVELLNKLYALNAIVVG